MGIELCLSPLCVELGRCRRISFQVKLPPFRREGRAWNRGLRRACAQALRAEGWEPPAPPPAGAAWAFGPQVTGGGGGVWQQD